MPHHTLFSLDHNTGLETSAARSSLWSFVETEGSLGVMKDLTTAAAVLITYDVNNRPKLAWIPLLDNKEYIVNDNDNLTNITAAFIRSSFSAQHFFEL